MPRKTTLSTFIIIVVNLILVVSVNAKTINANSCSRSDVQAAINSSISGDTVKVPPGNCTWSSAIYFSDSKKITVQGAGVNSTVITWTGSNAAVYLKRSGSRFTGFKIIIPKGSSGYFVELYGNGWRVDHCEFDNNDSAKKVGVYIRGTSTYPDPTGLIDNCVFRHARVNIHADASLTAHSSWRADYRLGSADFVFVEDCTFTEMVFGNAVDAQYGGNYVFRYNHVTNSCTEAHSADLSDGSSRAARLWEIYGNTFVCDNSLYSPFRQRGGTGVVFNNSVSGNFADSNILIDNTRFYKGECDTYPCRDQIGRGRDAWLWTDNNPEPPQALDPAYAWNNTNLNTGGTIKFKVINNCGAIIKENRDFYNAKKSGYTPYTYPHPLRGGISEPDTPSITNLPPGSTLSGSTETFSWNANGVSVSQWWLYVGTSPGAKDIYDSGSLGTAMSDTVNGLPTDGSTVYVRLHYVEGGSWKSIDATYTAFSGGGGAPAITSPSPGSTLSGSTETFSWKANGVSVSKWWLYVGTSPGAEDIYDSGSLGTATSDTISGLPTDGSTVYVRLWYVEGGSWESIDATYIAFTAGGGAPAITSPSTGSTLSGSTETFSWKANGVSVSKWWLYVGTSPGAEDIYDSGSLGTATSDTVSGLPTDGSTMYVRLWYVEGGSWKSIDATYTAFSGGGGGGTPAITSPSPGSTLSGSTETFSWNANGASVSEWWLHIGTSLGGKDIYNSGSLGTATSDTVNGLPTDGSTVYVRLYYIEGGSWKSIDATYTAQ